MDCLAKSLAETSGFHFHSLLRKFKSHEISRPLSAQFPQALEASKHSLDKRGYPRPCTLCAPSRAFSNSASSNLHCENAEYARSYMTELGRLLAPFEIENSDSGIVGDFTPETSTPGLQLRKSRARDFIVGRTVRKDDFRRAARTRTRRLIPRRRKLLDDAGNIIERQRSEWKS
jgi:hypothetical protein